MKAMSESGVGLGGIDLLPKRRWYDAGDLDKGRSRHEMEFVNTVWRLLALTRLCAARARAIGEFLQSAALEIG